MRKIEKGARELYNKCKGVALRLKIDFKMLSKHAGVGGELAGSWRESAGVCWGHDVPARLAPLVSACRHPPAHCRTLTKSFFSYCRKLCTDFSGRFAPVRSLRSLTPATPPHHLFRTQIFFALKFFSHTFSHTFYFIYFIFIYYYVYTFYSIYNRRVIINKNKINKIKCV